MDGRPASGEAGGAQDAGRHDASSAGTDGFASTADGGSSNATPDAPVKSGDDAPSGGGTCANDTECPGGYCVSGLCCDTPCNGQCECCNEVGSVGKCVAVKGAPVGGRAACGGTGICKGQCDGTNGKACAYPDSNTTCTAAICSAGKVTTASVCDGVGSCTSATSNDCPNAQCAADGSAKCATACTTASCGATAYCDTTGVCVPLKESGVSCSAGGQCTSGFCVDGVCCDGKCEGQCESCKEVGSVGKCKAVKGSPLATRTACGGDGVCKGQCDGTNGKACVFPNAATVCTAAKCADGQATTASVCNGSGACTTATTNPCVSNLCGTGGKCADSCTIDSCTAGKYCDSNGTCVPTLGNGKSCSPGQCTSGFCVDGVCCATKCDGQCESCKQAGYVGTCKAVTGDPVAPRTGCTGSAPCKGQCDGVTREACQYPGGSTSCTAARCTAGKLTTATACDSKGACTSSTIRDCASTLCSSDGLSCADSCAGLICGSGTYCNGTTCVPKKDLGATCNDGGECKSTFCADNKVCCNAACTERCKACNTSGVCTAVSGAVRHGTPCATDGTTCGGTCDGTHDDCVYPQNVSCGTPATCNAQMTMLSASTCNGAGGCISGGTNCQALDQFCDSATTSCKAKQTTAGASCSLPIQCNSGNCDANHCCPANNKWCGSSCVDTSTSKTNCGSCGNECSSVESCVGGFCTCNASLFCTGGTDKCGVWDFSSGLQGWTVSDPDPTNQRLYADSGKLVLHLNFDPSGGVPSPRVMLSICPSGAAPVNGYTLTATIRFDYPLTPGMESPNVVRLWAADGKPTTVQEIVDPAGSSTPGSPGPILTLSGTLGKDFITIGFDIALNQYFAGNVVIDDVRLTLN